MVGPAGSGTGAAPPRLGARSAAPSPQVSCTTPAFELLSPRGRRAAEHGSGAAMNEGERAAAGSSGSIGAARSPMWWRARPRALHPSTSCCRRTPSSTRTPRSRASATCWACARASPCRTPRSTRSRWAPRSPPTRCSSARARPPCSRSPAASGDALRIGYQNRPDIFARHIVLPEQLYTDAVEIEERCAPTARSSSRSTASGPRRPGGGRSPPATARSRSC